MHVRNLFLFAPLAMPIIAIPVPTNNVVPREDVVIEQRGFSIAQLYRDLFKREALIETIPRAASYDEAMGTESRSIVISGGGPSQADVDNITIHSGSPSKRKIGKTQGGGPSKRKVGKTEGGGPSKRKIGKTAGGGPSKRKIGKTEGGGPSKRKIGKTAGGGPSKRKIGKTAGGGPSKRG